VGVGGGGWHEGGGGEVRKDGRWEGVGGVVVVEG